MNDKYCIVGNWKMNFSIEEAKKFAKELKEALKDSNNLIGVSPSFVCIPGVSEILKGSNIKVFAQNMSNAESGAHTGEVSPSMLKGIADGIILGHSERRVLYKEDDKFINEKVLLALKNNFEVILCIGETLEEREAGKLETVLDAQISKGLEGVSDSNLQNIIIAYEPVWAIGTGKTASPEDAENAHKFIRNKIEKLYSKELSNKLIIQYGGSVKPDNVKELMSMPNINGALVGGASMKIDDFSKIVNF